MEDDKQVMIFLPYRLQVLHAHQSYFYRLAAAEDRGFQIKKHGTQTETWQTYLAAQLGLDYLDSFPNFQRLHA